MLTGVEKQPDAVCSLKCSFNSSFHLRSPHQCCISTSLISAFHPTFYMLRLLRLPPPGLLDTSFLTRLPPLLRLSSCPFARPLPLALRLLPAGSLAALSQTAGRSGSLIILVTVHLSDKTEESERPPLASLSFNGQPRNEGEAIKAGAEPESLFNVCDHPDRIINQELKEFKTFALGFLT